MAGWLERVNAHRALANLQPVVDDPALSQGDMDLTKYMVYNNDGSGMETPGHPGYTEAGAQAGRNSNVYGNTNPYVTDIRAMIAGWAESFTGAPSSTPI